MIAVLFSLIQLMAPQKIFRVEVEPIHYQQEDNPSTYAKAIKQIETNGKELFLLLEHEPGVLQIKQNGDFIRRIGERGRGPGELGFYASISIAVKDQDVWIRHENKSISVYESGAYKRTIEIKESQFTLGLASDAFLIGKGYFLHQAFAGTGRLAHIYDHQGIHTSSIGKIFPKSSVKYLRVNPALNNTFWQEDSEHYYSLFIFRPIIRIYSKQTNDLLQEFTFTGPEVKKFEEKFFSAKKDPNFHPFPKPHFTDFRYFRGDLYIMCEGVLYRLDGKNGTVKSRTIFWSKPEYAEWDTSSLNFPYFVITNNRQMYLITTSMDLGEDGLWKPVSFPFL